jgi:predicted RNase H-like HicB family nuclease
MFPGEATTVQSIDYTVHTFKEGGMFVAYVPELDISSCGRTNEEARRNIKDAVEGFLETSAETGLLEWILQEAGYSQSKGCWRAPEFVGLGREQANLR